MMAYLQISSNKVDHVLKLFSVSITKLKLNKSWKHYANWQKPVTKEPIMWFDLHQKSRTGKSMDRTQIHGCLGLGAVGQCGAAPNKFGVSTWHRENDQKLDVMMVIQLCEYAKNHWILYFKWEILWHVSHISTNRF